MGFVSIPGKNNGKIVRKLRKIQKNLRTKMNEKLAKGKTNPELM